ncbi:MAG TPA: hypothetical protein VFM69_13355, partial [Pricia sp.]|nr:hypothetical protein [Pricia sp.]
NLGGIHLTFAGHSDENYEAYVEISRKKNGKWIPARATDLQRKALQEKLDMHVEDIEQDQRRQRESNRAYSQEVDTFGMPGALYGKLY